MTDLNICPIPGDPDIAGIGVRAAIYAQAFLAACSSACLDFILNTYTQEAEDRERIMSDNTLSWVARARLAMRNPLVTPTRNHSSYVGLVKNLERSTFMIGFAVIISAVIQSKSILTPYHTLIILNISLINSWTGLQLLSSREGFRQWGGFKRAHFWNKLPSLAHLMMLTGFGFHFWINQRAFIQQYTGGLAPCQPLTYYWVFGPVDATNQTLKTASVVFYAAFIIFGFHLQPTLMGVIRSGIMLVSIIPFLMVVLFCVIPAALFLDLFIDFALYMRHININHPLPPGYYLDEHPGRLTSSVDKAFLFYQSVYHFKTIFKFLADAGLIIYLVVSTESIVKLNAPNVSVSENQWTYGQTLALFSATVSIILYGRDWWEILKQERGDWLERMNAAEAGRSEHLPENSMPNGEADTSEHPENVTPNAEASGSGDPENATRNTEAGRSVSPENATPNAAGRADYPLHATSENATPNSFPNVQH